MNSAVFVGMTRFELATSGPPDRCATGLRHIPGVSAPATTDAAMRHKTCRGFRSFEKQRCTFFFEVTMIIMIAAFLQKRVQRYYIFFIYPNFFNKKKRFVAQ